MTRKRNLFLIAITLILTLAVTFQSCKKDDEIPDPPDPRGVWIGDFESILTILPDVECNSVYIEISDNDVEVITFLNGNQTGGMRGGFVEHEDGDLGFTYTVKWIANNKFWAPIFIDSWEEKLYSITFSKDGNTVTFTDPDNTSLQFELVKGDPGIPTELEAVWGAPEMTLSVGSDGSFVMNSYGVEESGELKKISDAGGSNYLLVNITSVAYLSTKGQKIDGDQPIDEYKLFEFEFDQTAMRLTLTAGDMTIVFEEMQPGKS